MRRNFYICMVAALVWTLGACWRTADKGHTSKNSVDWDGLYTGEIPAADGPGIAVRITLSTDLTFAAQYEYLDREDGNFTMNGRFSWDKDGRIITLDTREIPPYYQVGENKLIQLDMEKKPITGPLANLYVLHKQMN